MSLLLVITTGQTDVQLVSGEFRSEFLKNQCAALHDQLELRQREWTVVDAPVSKSEQTISSLPPSPFLICTPKLDAVFDYLRERKLSITHALILETRRDPKSAPGDPRFAGAVLEKRLHEYKSCVVWREAILKDDQRLEDHSDPRDAVICRYIVSRIAEAVWQALDKGRPERIVIAATGGMPILNTLVEEVVQLYAASMAKVDLIEIADGAKRSPPVRDSAKSRSSVPEPAEPFRARRYALELIERGNFLAAWGCVVHLHGDEAERVWTQIVEWLYLFAASLPIPPECDIAVLTHQWMAVRAALRVELALKSGDIPRAVHGTVAFFEAALWDHLYSKSVRHPTETRLFQFDPVPSEKLIRSDSVEEDENRKRPFEPVDQDGQTWYRVDDQNVCAVRIAKHYLKNEKLTKLGQAISDVRDLRNDVAHNEPTPARMQQASVIMADKGLWSNDCRFLTPPLVQDVLRDLGEAQPNTLCQNLIADVRFRLLGRELRRTSGE